MKTITLTKVEYINFLKVAKQLAIDFTHQLKSGFILITANADTLIELGY
jgi:hypothetical protein